MGRLLRLGNPLARRMIVAGMPTGAPNVNLVIRGRRTGIERTVPVTMLEIDGRRFVQATYGGSGWARNLRAAGEATLIDHDRRIPVRGVEVPPAEAGPILHQVLAPYRRSRLLRTLVGPTYRPPIGILRRIRLRVDETPAEYVAEARRHPLFELL